MLIIGNKLNVLLVNHKSRSLLLYKHKQADLLLINNKFNVLLNGK